MVENIKLNLSIVSLGDGAYFDLKKIFKGVVCKFSLTSEQKLVDNYGSVQQNFIFTIGHRWQAITEKVLTKSYYNENIINSIRLNRKIIDSLDLKEAAHGRTGLSSNGKSGVTVWYGISTGKRTVLNDKAFLCSLIERLSEKYIVEKIVLDGYTSPLSLNLPPSYHKDADKIENLRRELPREIDFVVAAGKTAEEKIRIALDTDLIISNHSTGSIWISRILGSQCFTHISNKARTSSIRQHLHFNATLLSSDCIEDYCEQDGRENPFNVSYKISNSLKLVTTIAEEFDSSQKNTYPKPYVKYLQYEQLSYNARAIRDFKKSPLNEIVDSIKVVDLSGDKIKSVTESNFSFDQVFFESKAFTESLMNSVETVGYPVLKNHRDGREYICSHSIRIGQFNALKFSCECDFFYVFQYNYTAEEIFLPIDNLLICLNSNGTDRIKQATNRVSVFIERLQLYADQYKEYFLSETKFGGVLAHHNSPYHFYYFKMQALYNVISATKSIKLNVVVPSKGSFFKFGEIFPDRVEADLYRDDFTKSYNIKVPFEYYYKEFYICIGDRYSERDNDIITDSRSRFFLDRHIMYAARQMFESRSLCPKNYEKRIWVGISTGKRAWLEQAMFIGLFSRYLSEKYASSLILIDGWTALEKEERSHRDNSDTYKDDEILVSDLINSFPSNVQGVCLAGMTAMQKLQFCIDLDGFISNHATGSIWVSRVAGCRGLTHISNAARQSAINQHIHHNAVLIEAHHLIDEKGDAPTPFHVSYHIDPGLVLEKFKGLGIC